MPGGVWRRPRQPALVRASTAQTKETQVASLGSRPITLTRRRDSPKVRSNRLVWRMRRQCSAGKRRWVVRLGRSSRRQGHRRRIEALVALAEGPGAVADRRHGGLPRWRLDPVKDRPEGRLDLGLGGLGDLGQHVAGLMHETALMQAAVEDLLEGADQARGAIGDAQERWPQAPGSQPPQEVQPVLVALRAPAARPTSTLPPSVVMPQAHSSGSARREVGCILKAVASKYR